MTDSKYPNNDDTYLKLTVKGDEIVAGVDGDVEMWPTRLQGGDYNRQIPFPANNTTANSKQTHHTF